MSQQNKYNIENFFDFNDIGSLLESQVADDIVYGLAGNKRLITVDELTGKYHTFKVQQGQDGVPFVTDPDTGHKYLVKSSAISKQVDIYRIFYDTDGTPLVADWADMTVNKVELNKHKEVQFIPIHN